MTVSTVSDLNRQLVTRNRRNNSLFHSCLYVSTVLGIHLHYKLDRKCWKRGCEGFNNTGYLHIEFSNKGVSFWALLLNCFPVKKCEWLNENERLRKKFMFTVSTKHILKRCDEAVISRVSALFMTSLRLNKSLLTNYS